MPALPTETTSRLVVDYEWRGEPYTTLYRFATAVLSTTAVSLIDTFHTTIQELMDTDWDVLGTGLWYPEGITFSTPAVGINSMSGTAGATVATNVQASQFQVLGRGSDGRKASWYHQGMHIAFSADQRLTTGDNVDVAAMLTAHNDLIAEGLVTISGASPVLKGYINCVVNDYLTRQARRG